MSTAPLKEGEGVGPLPGVGQSVWFENMPQGPAEVCVEEIVPPALRTDAPRLGGTELPVRTGMTLRLYYHVAEAPCSADAVVVNPPPGKSGGPWVLVRKVERTQRRGAVRVPVLLVARVKSDAPVFERVVATEDISCTGVLLRSAEPIPRSEDPVQVVIHFGAPMGDMTLDARVVRMVKADGSARPWKVAVQFVNLNRSLEDRLVRFVFERQREIQSRAAGLT